MDACCHLSRRQLLRWAGLVAATPIVSALGDIERAYAAPSSTMVAVNLELVTVTESSAVLTWFTGDASAVDGAGRLAPVPADTEVLVGTSTRTLRTVLHDSTPTPYHYAEITGLEPGQTYFFLARSNGVVAVPSASTSGSPLGTSTAGLRFTTPEPPPRHASCSRSRCATTSTWARPSPASPTTQQGIELPPGIRRPRRRAAVPGGDGLGAGARDPPRGATSSSPATSRPKRRRSTWHGRRRTSTASRATTSSHAATTTACTPDQEDTFAETFFGDGPTWSTNRIGQLPVLGLDTYDKIGNGGDNGIISAEQLDSCGPSSRATPTGRRSCSAITP